MKSLRGTPYVLGEKRRDSQRKRGKNQGTEKIKTLRNEWLSTSNKGYFVAHKVLISGVFLIVISFNYGKGYDKGWLCRYAMKK